MEQRKEVKLNELVYGVLRAFVGRGSAQHGHVVVIVERPIFVSFSQSDLL